MKSQFDDVLRFDGTLLHARGPVTELRNPDRPHRVLWMVTQGDTMASGNSDVHGGEWHDHADAAPDAWRDGPALSAALLVMLKKDGTAETFAWSQEVQIRTP
jgi:hypothetical protein